MINTQADICKCEIAISGGGMVGLTLGIALADAGFKTVVIDELPPETLTLPSFDGRVSAIAFASRRLLEVIGVWDALAQDAQPINDIVVSDGRLTSGAAPLFLHFDHSEIGDEALGHIVENRHIRRALLARARTLSALTLMAPVRVRGVTRDARAAQATLSDGRVVEAKLVIGAEGRGSPLREAAAIKTLGWSYGQTGIVATVAHDKPHDGFAQEYFLPSGPFAILPMTGNRSSLVWTEKATLAPAFLALDEKAFDDAVAARVGPYLGRTHVEGPRWSYPLSLLLAERYVLPRLALVGDAAHAIHPIAGQGLNLGLRDVAALAEVITDAGRSGSDIGALAVLSQYERWRRFDNTALAAATDLLTRLFSNDNPALRLARDVGLAATNRFGFARKFFMRHAGGALGELPRLLRGEPL